MISFNNEQLQKEYSLIVVTENDNSTFVSLLQSLKVDGSIIETVDGIFISINDEQPQKADSPM